VRRGAATHRRSVGEILLEARHLVHPLVENRDDAHVPVIEKLPIDQVLLVAADETIDAELGRDRPS